MTTLTSEIADIPKTARMCLEKNMDISLPTGVPYVGMGASYIAALTLYYCSIDIDTQMASEYFWYRNKKNEPLSVCISQSGESTEILWCASKFQQIVGITNNPTSSLAKAKNSKQTILLHAGEENYSSTKTYINSLTVLYKGFGIDPKPAIDEMEKRFGEYRQQERVHATDVAAYITSRKNVGLYVIGSGPNMATAGEAALTLTETTKLPWAGMSVAQFDHGPKEAASNAIVVILNSHGKDADRIGSLKTLLAQKTDALVIESEESNCSEILSPIPLITRCYLFMQHLADELHVGDPFLVGKKVTTVI